MNRNHRIIVRVLAAVSVCGTLAGCVTMEERSGPLDLGIQVEKQADGSYCASDMAEWFYDTHTETFKRVTRCGATEAEARAKLDHELRLEAIMAPMAAHYYPPRTR